MIKCKYLNLLTGKRNANINLFDLFANEAQPNCLLEVFFSLNNYHGSILFFSDFPTFPRHLISIFSSRFSSHEISHLSKSAYHTCSQRVECIFPYVVALTRATDTGSSFLLFFFIGFRAHLFPYASKDKEKQVNANDLILWWNVWRKQRNNNIQWCMKEH